MDTNISSWNVTKLFNLKRLTRLILNTREKDPKDYLLSDEDFAFEPYREHGVLNEKIPKVDTVALFEGKTKIACLMKKHL